MRTIQRKAVLAAALVWAVACGKDPSVNFKVAAPGDSSPTIATFGQDAYTETYLKKYLPALAGGNSAALSDPARRKSMVEGMLRFEAAFQEALQRGLLQDPEVKEMTRKAMVQVLLRQEMGAQNNAVTEADIKAYYEQHLGDYQKPELTKLAIIQFATSQKALAEKVLAQAKKLPAADLAGFAALAKKHTQDKQASDGQLPFLDKEALEKIYGPTLVQAGSKLVKVGDLFPVLVPGPQGLHIVKMQGRQAATTVSQEQAAPSIRSLLAQEKKNQSYQAFLQKLDSKLPRSIDEAKLSSLKFDAPGPPDQRAIQPGYLSLPK